MKTKIIFEDKFKPFILEIKVESIQEARLLYHVFNHSELNRLFKDDSFYDTNSYNNDFSDRFPDTLYQDIKSVIQRQGFKI